MNVLELCRVVFCRGGGVQFKPWYRRESSDCFRVKDEYLDNIDIWYHEFNEEAIWYTLREEINLSKEYLNGNSIILSISKEEKEKYLPSHVIASLQGLSYFKDKLVSSDSYSKMLNWRSKSMEVERS